MPAIKPIFYIFILFAALFYPACAFAFPQYTSILFILISLEIITAAVLHCRFNTCQRVILIKAQDAQEEINALEQTLLSARLKYSSFEAKLSQYKSLSLLLEKLNKSMSLTDICQTLKDDILKVIRKTPVQLFIYLFDPKQQKLNFLYSYSLQNQQSIQKAASVYEEWVINHLSPLLIKDTASDFRFSDTKDSHKGVHSIISSPFLIRQRPLGVIRLDSASLEFTLEDLRILNSIAEISAAALNNAIYYRKIEELAIKDALTGLYLRAYAIGRMEEELKRAYFESSPLSVLMLDIDNFKKLNDQYGHLAGDIALKSLACWLNEALPQTFNIIGRIGGEEFLIALPMCDKKEAYAKAEGIRSLIQERKVSLRRQDISFTVSIGLANFPDDARDLKGLMNKADHALYEAKMSGRNRVVIS